MQAIAADTVLINGSFSNGLAGWTTEILGGAETQGTITVGGGQAQLLERSSFLISLKQRFSLPGGANRLSFDVFFDPGFDLTDDFIPDAFEVQLLDDNGESVAPTWDDLATSFFNVQEDLTKNLANGVTVQPIEGAGMPAFHVVLDLTGVPAGTIVTLYVDLIGADADTESGVRVDNFAINDQSGPPGPGPGGGGPGGGGTDEEDSDGDGVPNNRDECPATAVGTEVDETGCPIDDNPDGDDGTTVELNIECPSDVVVILCPSELAEIDEVSLEDPYFLTDEPLTFTISDDRPPVYYEAGLTDVTFSVTDEFRRFYTCIASVEVTFRSENDPECRADSGDLSIICPPAVIAAVPGNREATAEFIGLGEPVISGPPGTALDHDSPDEFPAGITTVTFTATSPDGDTVFCITDVLITPTDDTPGRGLDHERITTTTRTTGVCGSCGAIGIIPFFVMVGTLVQWKKQRRVQRLGD